MGDDPDLYIKILLIHDNRLDLSFLFSPIIEIANDFPIEKAIGILHFCIYAVISYLREEFFEIGIRTDVSVFVIKNNIPILTHSLNGTDNIGRHIINIQPVKIVDQQHNSGQISQRQKTDIGACYSLQDIDDDNRQTAYTKGHYDSKRKLFSLPDCIGKIPQHDHCIHHHHQGI